MSAVYYAATANDLEVTDDWFDAEETFTSSGGLDFMEGKMNSHFEAVTATDVQRSNECKWKAHNQNLSIISI